MTASEVRKLIRWARHRGCDVAMARSGHYRVTLDGRYVGTIAATPSDRRTLLNDRAFIRRRLNAMRAGGR